MNLLSLNPSSSLSLSQTLSLFHFLTYWDFWQMRSFFIFCCFLLFVFLDGPFAAAARLWSRTEMAEMNGYGENKLSSVVITGSLLCNTPVSGTLYIYVFLSKTVYIYSNMTRFENKSFIKVLDKVYKQFGTTCLRLNKSLCF